MKLPRCIHCKKTRMKHNAITKACPLGYYHRVTGYTSYHATNRWAEKTEPHK